ncbi:three-helix bundle dimerization domain-containing protein [Geodermatophilus chilensis]
MRSQASVRVAHARLAGARVEHFVPILLERAAADSLRRLRMADW